MIYVRLCSKVASVDGEFVGSMVASACACFCVDRSRVSEILWSRILVVEVAMCLYSAWRDSLICVVLDVWLAL